MSMIAYYLLADDATIEGLKKGEEELEAYLEKAILNEELCLDIDKSWAAIHYLLCGKVWEGERPLFNVVLGGQALSEEDAGYGPARFLGQAEVREGYEAIKPLDFSSYRQRFESEVLGREDIYPCFTDAEDFNYLEFNFRAIVEFFERASNEALNLILFIA